MEAPVPVNYAMDAFQSRDISSDGPCDIGQFMSSGPLPNHATSGTTSARSGKAFETKGGWHIGNRSRLGENMNWMVWRR